MKGVTTEEICIYNKIEGEKSSSSPSVFYSLTSYHTYAISPLCAWAWSNNLKAKSEDKDFPLFLSLFIFRTDAAHILGIDHIHWNFL